MSVWTGTIFARVTDEHQEKTLAAAALARSDEEIEIDGLKIGSKD